jgi:hypothetical protein
MTGAAVVAAVALRGGKILRLDPRVPGARPEVYALGLRVSTLVSFGQDAAGRLYAAGLDGDVYRLAR